MDQIVNLIKLCKEGIPPAGIILENKKWYLLACDVVLKEHGEEEMVYIRALEVIAILIKTAADLSQNDWDFIIDSTRKGVKRVGQQGIFLLTLIRSSEVKCTTDRLLKLILTCRELEIPFEYDIEPLYRQYFPDGCSVDIDIDFDEFYFIKSEKYKVTLKQRCKRLLLLINPLVPLEKEYCFALFSVSDSDLIKYMKRLIRADEGKFIDFYVHVIEKELLSVDFFIEQLLTDSVALLELLLDIFSVDQCRYLGKDFKNFHTLLLLKLEISCEEFPFDCEILMRKLKIFLKKM